MFNVSFALLCLLLKGLFVCFACVVAFVTGLRLTVADLLVSDVLWFLCLFAFVEFVFVDFGLMIDLGDFNLI